MSQSVSTSLVLICDSAWAQHIWQGLSGRSASPVFRGSLCCAALTLAPEGTKRLPMAGLWPERAFQIHKRSSCPWESRSWAQLWECSTDVCRLALSQQLRAPKGGVGESWVAEVVLLYLASKVLGHWGAVRVEQLQLERLRTPLLGCPSPLADGAPTLKEKMSTQICPVTRESEPASFSSAE